MTEDEITALRDQAYASVKPHWTHLERISFRHGVDTLVENLRERYLD